MVGTKKKLFLCFSSSKNLEIMVWRSCPPAQSIGRGRISREGALNHRESRERRDKIFAEKTENAKIFKRKIDQENSFQWGFWPRENELFWGVVWLQNWLASDHPGVYTSMPHPFFGAKGKDVCYINIEKRWPNKKLFLARRACMNITNVSCAKKRVGHACICPSKMVTG